DSLSPRPSPGTWPIPSACAKASKAIAQRMKSAARSLHSGAELCICSAIDGGGQVEEYGAGSGGERSLWDPRRTRNREQRLRSQRHGRQWRATSAEDNAVFDLVPTEHLPPPPRLLVLLPDRRGRRRSLSPVLRIAQRRPRGAVGVRYRDDPLVVGASIHPFVVQGLQWGVYGSLGLGCLWGVIPVALLPLAPLAICLRWGPTIYLALAMGFTKIFQLTFFSKVTVATNRTVPSGMRSSMNGLGGMGAGVAKAIGPMVVGFWMAWCLSWDADESEHLGLVRLPKGSLVAFDGIDSLGLVLLGALQYVEDEV
ncbi:hypothetical protein ACHAWF_001170, partial [Thalassiosira exigua]